MLMVAIVFGRVALKSTEKADYKPIVKKWYKVRKVYGTGLVIFMIIVMIYTLRELPFNQPVYSESSQPTIIDVEAIQFGWNISQTEFVVGESIEFNVTTDDVTHGFGIYD